MSDWLVPGEFKSHSGLTLPFKIECDNLTDTELEVIANIIYKKCYPFCEVIGIATGGDRLAEILKERVSGNETDSYLIVDDVFTTGNSMEEKRRTSILTYDLWNKPITGAVIFARKTPPLWIYPVFYLNQ
jgi:orotate phosphoribosyltransferase